MFCEKIQIVNHLTVLPLTDAFFLKLVHPESQANYRNHSFVVEWDKLSPWCPSLNGHPPQPPSTPPQKNDFYDLLGTPDAPVSKIVSVKGFYAFGRLSSCQFYRKILFELHITYICWTSNLKLFSGLFMNYKTIFSHFHHGLRLYVLFIG